MPRRKEAEQFAEMGEKDSWHLYGLQVLNANRFATVVSKILSGRYMLINTRMKSTSLAAPRNLPR